MHDQEIMPQIAVMFATIEDSNVSSQARITEEYRIASQ